MVGIINIEIGLFLFFIFKYISIILKISQDALWSYSPRLHALTAPRPTLTLVHPPNCVSFPPLIFKNNPLSAICASRVLLGVGSSLDCGRATRIHTSQENWFSLPTETITHPKLFSQGFWAPPATRQNVDRFGLVQVLCRWPQATVSS